MDISQNVLNNEGSSLETVFKTERSSYVPDSRNRHTVKLLREYWSTNIEHTELSFTTRN
jgi:hypothetical protein